MTPEPWRDNARCLDATDPEVFYPVGKNGYANTAQIEVAKQFCHSCPVRTPCLTEALARGDDWGIWGGQTPAERRQTRRHGPPPELTGMARLNKAKTHCPQQHPYTPENTYIGAQGRRHCRACSRIKVAEKRRRVARAVYAS